MSIKSQVENTIERVVDYIEIHNNIDSFKDKKRQRTIDWGVNQILDYIEAEINPIINELKELTGKYEGKKVEK